MTTATFRTAWGSKQITVPGLPPLTQAEETALRQEWRTPPNFWAAIDEEFAFDIDVAASAKNTLCPVYVDAAYDALSDFPWIHPEAGILRAYCNPGFSNMQPWLKKAAPEAQRDLRAVVCVLGLCAPSTKWWRTAVAFSSEIRLLSPRVQFQSPDPRIPQSSNARDCALFVFKGNVNLACGTHIVTWEWK